MNQTKASARGGKGPAKSTPNQKSAPNQKVNPAVRRALRGEKVSHDPFFAFGPLNYGLMFAGLACAGLGFGLLARGDATLAPFLLVLGYCGLIPLGIEIKPRAKSAGGGE